MQGVFDMMDRQMKRVGKWFDKFTKWFNKLNSKSQSDDYTPGNGHNWGDFFRVFAWIFCVGAVCALAFYLRLVISNRKQALSATAAPVATLPDLASDDIAADQLPEDEWLNLARQMMERGDLRLALRALYLAALAHLSQRRFISIARYKSNRDYQRELRRRRPAEAELNATFADAVASFDRAWYGMHEVTRKCSVSRN